MQDAGLPGSRSTLPSQAVTEQPCSQLITYRVRGYQLSCASLSLLFAVDDRLEWATLNHHLLDLPHEQSSGHLASLGVAAGSDLFVAGENRLTLGMSNRNGGTGIYVEGRVVLDCAPPPAPPPSPPPPPSLEHCGLDPLMCRHPPPRG